MYNLTHIFDGELNLEFIFARDSAGQTKTKRFVCFDGIRPFSRFFYVTNGAITFNSIDNSSEILKAESGDIVYLPDNVQYVSVIDDTENFDYLTTIFCLTDAGGNRVTVSDDICIIAKDTNSVFLKVFREISDIYVSNKLGYKFLCRSIMWKLLHDIFIDYYTEGEYSDDIIYDGVLYIESHYRDFSDVNALSKKCGLCPSAFRKKFHEKTGKSPIEYRNYIRAKKALELLRSGEYNACEAADAVGFSDSFYFCKTFKKFYGTSPMRYVKQK